MIVHLALRPLLARQRSTREARLRSEIRTLRASLTRLRAEIAQIDAEHARG